MTGTRRAGEFCWINMLTPQPAEARGFFAKLLGWTFVEMPGMGHRARVGGREIGALFDLEAPSTPQGTTPHIGGLVKVDSADALCEKVISLGGKAMPAFDIGDQGRLAACTDPNGARFVVWELKEFLGTDADSSHHGAPSWFVTMTTNVDRAAKFYSGLFGWTPEVMATPGLEYKTFMRGTECVAGIMQITPLMQPMQPHWATFFTVRDADETAREAVKLGAKVCAPVQEIPGRGRFCGITSPLGVPFYVIKYDH